MPFRKRPKATSQLSVPVRQLRLTPTGERRAANEMSAAAVGDAAPSETSSKRAKTPLAHVPPLQKYFALISAAYAPAGAVTLPESM